MPDFLAAYSTNCGGHLPGVACGLEINAISFGKGSRLKLDPNYVFHVLFSVDEFAVGRPSPAGFEFTDVFQEGFGREAAGDMFFSTFTGIAPFGLGPNAGYADGNGRRVTQGASHVFGLGLVEPITPDQGTVDSGDNVDAINYGKRFDETQDVLFFSMEGGFPRCNEAGASFDAAANQPLLGGASARAADVLLYVPGSGGVRAYARAQELGLDLFGLGTDDIDALMVVENGQPGYQAPASLYDWDGVGGSDLILFSLRCGSATVGMTDPVTNREIGEGDILIKLAGTSGLPQVFLPAESLGLRSLAAGDTANDELNGLDIFDDDDPPFLDCNMNMVDDAIDISYNTSTDVDNNGIPDECEDGWSPFCDCTLAANSPCGNVSGVGRGCRNASGLGARLDGAGTTSVNSDALELHVTDMNPGSTSILFGGLSTTSFLFSNGRRCVVPTGNRLGVRMDPGGTGACTYGPGLIGAYPGTLMVMSGSTFLFQVYYRDVDTTGMACGSTANFTNALMVPFTP
ncbi:hypothetical protein [Planctomycetes bacterium Poly30]|uniref:hypothetical protein n=1 Tax=Saltatorellus ferox TaxID=2528018 RepID=UPI0011A4CD19